MSGDLCGKDRAAGERRDNDDDEEVKVLPKGKVPTEKTLNMPYPEPSKYVQLPLP